MRARRYFIGASLVVVLSSVMGAGTAYAYSWAGPKAPVKVVKKGDLKGGGYGKAKYVSYNKGRLVSYLSDAKVDEIRTFVSLKGTNGSQGLIGTQSGRRSDGGVVYKKMKNKSFFSDYPLGVQQYTYHVKVCMDRPFKPDWCKISPKNPHPGL